VPIDVIKPALPAQTHAPIAIHFAFGVSRTSLPSAPCHEHYYIHTTIHM